MTCLQYAKVHKKLFAIASGDFVSKECVINDCKTENAGGLKIKKTRWIHFLSLKKKFCLLPTQCHAFVSCLTVLMHSAAVSKSHSRTS